MSPTSPAAIRIRELQERRDRAAALFAEGVRQAEVARRLGVSAASVCRWHKAWKRKGAAGLRLLGRLGRRPELDDAQRTRLTKALLEGALAQGFPTDLWTLPRIAQLIERLFGVHYHPGYVWWVIRSLGWSLQRPTTRARERDEGAIASWRKTEWPQLKKGAAH
jgi:transposase